MFLLKKERQPPKQIENYFLRSKLKIIFGEVYYKKEDQIKGNRKP